jgi:hypothetical protein
MTVQLTAQLDKELMNRPFYWHYLEKTGGVPNPMKLTFITDPKKAPDSVKGETIHFGSPRLHQIFQSTKDLAAYIRLYEKHNFMNKQTPLFPWLCLNVKISWQCDRKRDVFRSIGLQLITGQMVEDFHNTLIKIPLTPKIPDYSFTLSPLIKPVSGINRIKNFITNEINNQEHHWAAEARNRWQKDLQLLDHFYENVKTKMRAMKLKKKPSKINMNLKSLFRTLMAVSII